MEYFPMMPKSPQLFLDKGKPNKNEISNFRPVSILNTISKNYEKVIKDQLVSGLDKYLWPFISVYQKGYSTQHVLTPLEEEWRERLDNNYIVGAILMDLSKVFDCISHDLIIAKLAAYGLDDTALQLIFSYLKNRKHCVRINNTYSNFENIITGVPQGWIVGPLLFDFSINDLFFFIESSSIHNFADDNTLSALANTISDLINKLESDSNIAIEWFKMNKMIVNPDKFPAIVLNKKCSDITNSNFQAYNQVIKSVSSVELLGIQIDNKLNFNLHISKICKSAANQLNALIRLKQFLSFHAKEVLIDSYIISNFNYCPSVWMFSSAQSLKEIENLQKRPLRFLYDDFEACYKYLLSKGGKSKMNVRRLRTFCVKIYKTLNDLNPSFMNDIFKLKINGREVCDKYKLNLDIPKWNQITFGYKSLKVLGPKSGTICHTMLNLLITSILSNIC